jgi:hypothetical protein
MENLQLVLISCLEYTIVLIEHGEHDDWRFTLPGICKNIGLPVVLSNPRALLMECVQDRLGGSEYVHPLGLFLVE